MMKESLIEVVIVAILVMTFVLGFFPNSRTEQNPITGYTVLQESQGCLPHSQKCGLGNIKYECNSHGGWYRNDCPSTDYCTEISLTTAECTQRP